MKFKTIIILILFMMLSIGAASAASIDDIQMDDSILADSYDDTVMATQDHEEDTITNFNNENSLNGADDNTIADSNEETLSDGETKSFTELNTTIRENLESDSIELNDNYTYNSSPETGYNATGGIIIENKNNFIIDGKGHVIDAADNDTRIFRFVNCTGITIQNLVFKNANTPLILLNGSNVTTINVTFECNYDEMAAGAVYSYQSNYYSYNDTFKNNIAKKGASIYADGGSVANIKNATFISDKPVEWGLIYGGGGSVVNITDCEFWNLSSSYATVLFSNYIAYIRGSKFVNINSTSGGAIGLKSAEWLNITDCQFINVSSSKNGGAIFADLIGDGGVPINVSDPPLVRIANSLFENCSSMFGGAILQIGGSLEIDSSNFTNNIATYLGGAIFSSNVIASTIVNSIFEINKAVRNSLFETGGSKNSLADAYGNFSAGAIYWDSGNLTVSGSKFINNSGAISIYDSLFEIYGSNFTGNTIAIKSYFDNEGSSQYKNTLNGDKISLENGNYVYNVDETGVEIPYNPIIIDAKPEDPSFDLRNWSGYNFTTPVKDQGSMGACWAFGAASALESAFLKATGMTLDISENNLKGVLLAYSMFGSEFFKEGASSLEAPAYLLSYLGIVNESQDSYDQLGKISPVFLNKNTYHIQNVLLIPERNVSDEAQCKQIDMLIKQALIDYGAVNVYIYGAHPENGEGFNENTSSQFIGNPDLQGNHYVAIVGWDDNYSASNFAPYTYEKDGVEYTETVETDGAWIVKNSWGENFGDGGYYYVSYKDTTIATAYSVAYIINKTPLYNTVFQYDFDLTGFGEAEKNYTNYYLAKKDEILSAVGTYFNESNVSYTIYVLFGDNEYVVYKQSGKSLYGGYHTIELNKKIAIPKGQNFAICIECKAAPYFASSRVNLPQGVCYVDELDMYSTYGYGVCLKAYTMTNSISTDFYYIPTEKFTLNLGVSGQKVVIEYNGTNTTVTTDSKGNAVLNKQLKLGTYLINVYYNNTKVSYPVHVFKSVEMASSAAAAYNTHIVIHTYFYGWSDVPLNKKYVTVKLDKQTLKIDTDSKGYIPIALDGLSIGTHTLTVTNPVTGQSASCKIKVVSRFSNNKNIVMDYYNGTKYRLRVYGDSGKVVGAGQVVVFKLNKKTYKIKTDKNGWATLSIPNTVIPKKYTVTATYKGQTVKNTITVKRVLKASNFSIRKTVKRLVLRATLKTSKKKAIKGKIVRFKFRGKTYKAKTNKKGIAQVTIKRSVIKKLKAKKTYKVAIIYYKDTIKRNVKVRN